MRTAEKKEVSDLLESILALSESPLPQGFEENYLQNAHADVQQAYWTIQDARFFLEQINEELKAIGPVAAELRSTESLLPFLVPDIEQNAQQIVWEGSPQVPKDYRDLSFVNAQALLSYWFMGPSAILMNSPQVLTEGHSISTDIGLGQTTNIYIAEGLGLTAEGVAETLAQAVSELSVPSDRENYFASIGQSARVVRVVSKDEINVLWRDTLRSKAEWAQKNFYLHPDQAKQNIIDVYVGLDFVPFGLYDQSSATIYLSTHDGNLGETFQHELAHAGQTAFSSTGIFSEDVWTRQIDPWIRSQMPFQSDVSQHPLFVEGAPQGAEEYRTDALVMYWKNPEGLAAADRGAFFRLYDTLHHQENQAELNPDDDTDSVSESQPPIPVNPFSLSSDEKQALQELALDNLW